jgi:hypothetical protein
VVVGEVPIGTPHASTLQDAQRELLLAARAPVAVRGDVPPIVVTAHHEADNTLLELVGPEESLRIEGPADELMALEGALIAAVPGRALATFAAVRCLALEGVHAVVAWGTSDPSPAVRARACENRVFVLGCGAEGWCVVDPRGVVLHEATWEIGGSAARCGSSWVRRPSKHVAPRTDMLADRRPAQYYL